MVKEGGEDKDTSRQLRSLPDFMFSKNLPDVIGRVLTEIAGAPFIKQASSSAKGKRSTAAASATEGEGTLDVSDLLHPKKKTKRVAKRKAAPKASTQGDAAPASAAELEEDVTMNDGQDGQSSRARWWIDDVLSCIAHAAGGSLFGNTLAPHCTRRCTV